MFWQQDKNNFMSTDAKILNTVLVKSKNVSWLNRVYLRNERGLEFKN